jgi:hypothetical protein
MVLKLFFLLFCGLFSSGRRFGAESDEKEIEGEAKAKRLIAHKDKVGCAEDKMREDENDLGRLDAYVRNFEPV